MNSLPGHGLKLLLALLLGGGLSVIAAAQMNPGDTVGVRLTSDAGVIELELYPDQAPITVANFLRYLDAGYYNGSQFYRVVRMDNQPQSPVKIEVIQGGLGIASYEDGRKPEFPPIVHETTRMSGLKHSDGALSMARLEPGSATSEFFVCIGDQPSLDFGGARNPDGQGFAVFGRVTAGMDVVRSIQQAVSDAQVPVARSAVTGQVLDEPVVIRLVERI
jgi:peptidyl-prolyl cis-trans isomerase A (cyclophilin A)